MSVSTFSISVGDGACDAKCPYCVSAMTPPAEVTRETPINETNFKRAAALARGMGCQTAMLTGKGEPTLRRAKLERYLDLAAQAGFPLIELQTNGLAMGFGRIDSKDVANWRERGLTMVAISCAGFDPEANARVFAPGAKGGVDVRRAVMTVLDAGVSVRMSTILHAWSLVTPDDLDAFLAESKALGVAQNTLVPVNRPAKAKDSGVWDWVGENALSQPQKEALLSHLRSRGTLLARLPHGAEVFDMDGANVCWSECLTVDKDVSNTRNLIFHDDGRLFWSWEFEGARVF